MSKKSIKYIVFDHDGTLVDTSSYKRRLFPGIKDLLRYLKEQGLELFVWTARDRRSTIEILESLAIMSEFSMLNCAGESSAKPSSEGISSMLTQVDPSEVAVIGDSLGDMLGGREYGAYSIGALWAHGSEDSKQLMFEHGADETCLTVNDLKNLITKNI